MSQETVSYYEDFSEIEKKIWSLLVDAVKNRSSEFRTPVFICGNDKDLDGRVVVLRKADQQNNFIQYHSDIRSSKIEKIKKNPNCSILFYGKEEKIQLRITGKARYSSAPTTAPTAAALKPTYQKITSDDPHFGKVEVLLQGGTADISKNSYSLVAIDGSSSIPTNSGGKWSDGYYFQDRSNDSFFVNGSNTGWLDFEDKDFKYPICDLEFICVFDGGRNH